MTGHQTGRLDAKPHTGEGQPTAPVISARELSVVRGKKQILRIPEVSVAPGEILAVTGPNGAGKSTLLKALGFLEPVSAGELFFKGRQVKTARDALAVRRGMAMVFQEPLLLSGTVLYNVTIGLKLRGLQKEKRLQLAEYWLEKLKIAQLADRNQITLSGGEAQRVSLARALALEPDVLFMDEPFNYLDLPTRAALVSELKEILVETGTTAVMVTHDLNEIPFLADRLIVMIEGEIAQAGAVDRVLSHPENISVAEFLGVGNIWPGRISRHEAGRCEITLADGRILLEAGTTRGDIAGPDRITAGRCPAVTEAAVCIRPEYLRVITEAENTTGMDKHVSAANRLKGKIVEVYPYGYSYRLRIEPDTGRDFRIIALVPAAQFLKPPKPGETVSVYIPPEKIHIIQD